MSNNIVIVGAGIAGATLWRCLRAKGITATLFESASQTARHSYPVTLSKTSLEPLARLSGSTVDNLTDLVAARKLTTHSAVIPDADERSVNASRQKLERDLLAGASVQTSVAVDRYKRQNDTTTLYDADSRATLASGSLVVIADGVHSSLRPALTVLPFVVVNGKRRIPLVEFEGKLLQEFRGLSSLETRHGDALLRVSYWLHDDGDRVVVSWTYSRPSREQDPLWKPERSKSAAGDIPDALYAELKELELDPPFADVFKSEKVREDRKLSWLMRKSLLDEATAKDLADRKIVVIGDAAHATPILGTKGAEEAVRDAFEVADLVSKGPPYDLLAFYQRLLPVWIKEVESSEARLMEMHGLPRTKPAL